MYILQTYKICTLYVNKNQPATTGGYAKHSAPRMRHSKSILAYKCASLTYIHTTLLHYYGKDAVAFEGSICTHNKS